MLQLGGIFCLLIFFDPMPYLEISFALAVLAGFANVFGAAIVAAPVSEKSLETGKPSEAAASSNNESAKATENPPAKSQTESASGAEPAKKKGHLHILKKVVKPF